MSDKKDPGERTSLLRSASQPPTYPGKYGSQYESTEYHNPGHKSESQQNDVDIDHPSNAYIRQGSLLPPRFRKRSRQQSWVSDPGSLLASKGFPIPGDFEQTISTIRSESGEDVS